MTIKTDSIKQRLQKWAYKEGSAYAFVALYSGTVRRLAEHQALHRSLSLQWYSYRPLISARVSTGVIV